MELTRRDALAALAASGVAVAAGTVLDGDDGSAFDASPFAGDSTAGKPTSEDRVDALLAVAEVVYPSEVSGVEEFVRTYALGRVEDREAKSASDAERRGTTREDREEYRRGMVEALDTLDEYARTWHDADFRDLDSWTRESVLDQMGVDTADSDPEGSDPDRVRYYLVNELLLALYASPTGGRLVGTENPPGHPGGTTSYQRGPNADGGGR